jgi:CRISPR-associated protein Csd1
VQYVLGWADNTTRPGRVSECHQAFIALCQSWASAEPGDETAAAVMRFYTGGAIGDVPQPEGKWSAKDIVLLAVDEVPITASDSLWRHWQRVVEDRKSGAAGATGARQGICLVCGTAGSLLNRMPQALPKTLVPRADQEVVNGG